MKKFLSVILMSVLFITLLAMTGQAAGLVIENMKTDNLVTPLGIDSENPVFSWNLSDPETRSQKQTSYRVTVAESEDALLSGTYVWDSGVVASDETAYITYNGEELSASTRYYWSVEVGDKDGNTVNSDVSWFETGLMDEGWSGAKWIAKTDALLDGYYDITTFTMNTISKL